MQEQNKVNQTSNTNLTPTPPPITTESSKKGLLVFLSLFSLVSLCLAGFFGYKYWTLSQQPTKQADQAQPTPAPSSDPTANWDTYSNTEYSFRYPQGLESDTEAAGQGYESIRIKYIGPAQIGSGKTQTSIFDGYSFTVTKIASNTSITAEQIALEEKSDSEANCDFDQATISTITQAQIAGIDAFQYSVTGCFGDYTSSYIKNNSNLYRITQLYSGENPEKEEYMSITNQILSTFQFTNNQIPESDWETYTQEKLPDNPEWKIPWKGYRLYYPPNWTITTQRNESYENNPGPSSETTITSPSGDYLTILQAAGDSGVCIFPDQDEYNKYLNEEISGANYPDYIEVSRNDNVSWRLAKLSEANYYTVLCEKNNSSQSQYNWGTNTIIGYPKISISSEETQKELEQILSKIEVIQ